MKLLTTITTLLIFSVSSYTLADIDISADDLQKAAKLTDRGASSQNKIIAADERAPSGGVQRCGVRDNLDVSIRPKFDDSNLRVAAFDKKFITIPVVFHVIYKDQKGGGTFANLSQDKIKDQIDVMNKSFSGSGFQFRLARVTRTNSQRFFDNCFNLNAEEEMKKSLAVDVANSLNVYSCAPKNSQGDLLGFAYFPQDFPEQNKLHGVLLRHSTLPGSAGAFGKGDTLVHEVGHYLGLFHTFEGGCSQNGDAVADTPAEKSAATGCPTGRDTCPGLSGKDPIKNFMDYSDDSCMDHFSSGQVNRMQTLSQKFKPSLFK